MAQNAKHFVMQRREWAMMVIRIIAALTFRFNNVVIVGSNNLPRTGPALLLSKHRRRRDSLLLGLVLYQQVGRSGNFVMRLQTNKISKVVLELIGGVTFVRHKDIEKLRPKRMMDYQKSLQDEINKNAYLYLQWLYECGEIVICYPEGNFFQNSIGLIKTGIIDHALSVEQDLDMEIPFITIGIDYPKGGKIGTDVIVRVGCPQNTKHFKTRRDLHLWIKEELASLSNIVSATGID